MGIRNQIRLSLLALASLLLQTLDLRINISDRGVDRRSKLRRLRIIDPIGWWREFRCAPHHLINCKNLTDQGARGLDRLVGPNDFSVPILGKFLGFEAKI